MKTSKGGEKRSVDVHKQTPRQKRCLIESILGLILLAMFNSASTLNLGGFEEMLYPLQM
ncbi:MAG: hypothetical protein ACOYYI_17805 [Chloroflexota bacterium]